MTYFFGDNYMFPLPVFFGELEGSVCGWLVFSFWGGGEDYRETTNFTTIKLLKGELIDEQ